MKCNKCGCTDTDNFYKYSNTRCKDCYSSRWGTYNDKEKKRQVEKWRAKNKDKIREYYREWYKKNGRKRNPIKEKAHSIVRGAIISERLIRPSMCSKCKSGGRIEAHHNDYNKPLEVIWLCNKCHRFLHRGESN
jgi:hypothetical protein